MLGAGRFAEILPQAPVPPLPFQSIQRLAAPGVHEHARLMKSHLASLALLSCLFGTSLTAAELSVQDGLRLHLEAQQQPALRTKAQLPGIGNGMPLDRWIDTGHPELALVQPWANSRPVYRSDGESAMVRFDGKDDFLALLGTSWKFPEATLFILAAPRGNPGGFSGMFGAAAAGQNDYTSGINVDQGPAASDGFQTLNIESAGAGGFRNLLPSGPSAAQRRPLGFGEFHVFTIRCRSGASGIELFVDGSLVGSRPRAESMLSFDELVLGGRIYSNEGAQFPHAQSAFQGDISSVLLYDRALPDAQLATVEKSLEARIPGLTALAQGTTGHPLEVLTNAPLVQMLVPGFTVEELPVVLRNLTNVRYRHDGKLVALGYDGRIYLVTDTNGDGREDHATVFWDQSQLRGPIGMALLPAGDPRGDGVYVASKGKVSLILDKNRDGVGDEEIIVATGWKEITQNVDAIGLAVSPKDGSIYFGLGTANFANGYLIDAKTGESHYDLLSDRGTIQKVSPDFKKRETVCTGVRFTCALAFNAAGDLFATEQEGATWLPNGNPLDELLQILPGRHYGFPPRHPKHLPQVVDEPGVFEYAPQHQSTVGMVFNQGVNGGPAFGPSFWKEDALICGESRGKLYRTKLVSTPEGYVAQNQIIACLNMLTVDTCVTPKGDLLIACHSGPPDWGTGPAGTGKVFRVHYAAPTLPQPVSAWASAADEFRIAFDRPLEDSDWAGAREKTRIEAGRFVSAGDRFETIRPGYQVVRDQMAVPRQWVDVQSVSLSSDRRTLVLRVPRQTQARQYAITLPIPARWKVESPIRGIPDMDIQVSLNGIQASLRASASPDSTIASVILPHPSLAVSKQLTEGSADHEAFFRECGRVLASTPSAAVSLRAEMDRGNIFVPAVQPGATLDWDIAADRFANQVMDVQQKGAAEGFQQIRFEAAPPKGLSSFQTAYAGGATWMEERLRFVLEDRFRPIPLNRVFLPWVDGSAQSASPGKQGPVVRTDVKGNWLHGRRVFMRDGGCVTCHRIRGEGQAFGPDLSNLIYRDRESVWNDIVKPSATLNPDHTGSLVKLKNGQEIQGLMHRITPEKISLRLPAGVEVEHAASEVASIEPMKTSLMPEGLGALLTEEQKEDLLTFLLVSPLEPARISRLDPAMPPARSTKELEPFLNSAGWGSTAPAPLRILLSIDEKDHGLDEHDYPVWQERWAKLLKLADQVQVQTCKGFPSAELLAATDVTVFYGRNAGWSPQAAAALDTYQARGGGLVYLHWGMEGGKDADALAERIGLATGGSKYRHGELELVMTQPKHPILAGLVRLHLLDESYWAFHGDPTRIQTLATSVEEQKPEIQMWTYEHGKGRVVGSIPGHYTWTFDDPVYRVIVLRSIAWAANQPVDRLLELAPVGARLAP